MTRHRRFAQPAPIDVWVRHATSLSGQDRRRRPCWPPRWLGTTIDFSAAGRAPWIGDFERTRSARWLAAHGPEYGFVLSYPVTASGLTLREWLWSVSGTSPTLGDGHSQSAG